MDSNLILFLYLLVGITFSFSAINLIVGMQKGGDKAYTILGLMGICVGIYTIMFPMVIGLVQYSIYSKIALFFFLANFALLPWFLCYFTGYCNRKVQWGLSSLMALSYIILLIADEIFGIRLWNIVGHISLILIIWFGFVASNYQIRKDDRSSGFLLLGALIIFGLLTVDDIFRMYFNDIYPIQFSSDILPLDYFLIFFLAIMGIRLARDMQRKYQLEKSINLQEKRWSGFLEKVKLLVIGVDGDGNVNYLNPFFMETTGFDKNEIMGNHYMNIIPEKDRPSLKELTNNFKRLEDLNYYQNTILTNHGQEKIINWTVVGMYNNEGELINTISIGSDITDQNNAINEIRHLKSQLEEENIFLKTELGKIPAVEKIIGSSDGLRYVLQRALQVAPTDSTVLLEGETGVGKELVANFIKQNSKRVDKPFIIINCAAIPSTLLESELFGHLKGAFTGADRNKKGMVEMADGGTLFLDEIGEFPLELQPKLLRFLQEGEFNPLGSETSRKVDARIIAATNRELLKEIDKGRFRNDLYYRLYVYPITIPPLRNRIEDIPDLIDVFVKRLSKKHGKSIKKISKPVMEELKIYNWPGNIRELENVIEHAVIVSTSDTIKLKDINPMIIRNEKSISATMQNIVTLQEVEREHILLALKQTNWQIHGSTGAAEVLGINPNTLRSRMKKLSIIKPA